MTGVFHVVAETAQFLRDAEDFGLTSAEVDAIVDHVAGNPRAGDEVRGSGGVRKFRVAGRGKGKSGGYRVVSGYVGLNAPVYLMAILSKGERANFSDAEIARFRRVMSEMKRNWRGADR